MRRYTRAVNESFGTSPTAPGALPSHSRSPSISGCAISGAFQRRAAECRAAAATKSRRAFRSSERTVQAVATRRRGAARSIIEPRHDRRAAVRTHVASAIDRRHRATSRRLSLNTSTSIVKRPPVVTEIEVQRAHPDARADLPVVEARRTFQFGMAVEHPAAPRLEHRRNARLGGARVAAARPSFQSLRSERAASASHHDVGSCSVLDKKSAADSFTLRDHCTGDVESGWRALPSGARGETTHESASNAARHR